ncbi:hypothetical protein ABIB38_003761 [Massilia sp. UYP11]
MSSKGGEADASIGPEGDTLSTARAAVFERIPFLTVVHPSEACRMACRPQERKRRPCAVVSIYNSSTPPDRDACCALPVFPSPCFPGLIGVPLASCQEACRFRYKCRTDGHRHRDPNGTVTANSAASGNGCLVAEPSMRLVASSPSVGATWSVFATVSCRRAGQNRHGRAKPGGRARCGHTRRRVALEGRRAGAEGRRRTNAPWRVGWGKAPHGPGRAVGAHNGPHPRKAFHSLG